MPADVKLTITRAANVSKTKHNAYVKEANKVLGETYVREIIPKHFSSKFESEYNYQPRSEEYQLRKTKLKGHRNPLVWTGTTRTIAKNTSSVSATSKRCLIRIPAPILNRLKQGRTSKGGEGRAVPDARKELATVSAKDIKLGIKILTREYTKQLKADTTKKVWR